jgi:hypothetical protein
LPDFPCPSTCGGAFSLSKDGVISVSDSGVPNTGVGETSGDALIPVPKRWSYNLNDVFNKNQDLLVFVTNTNGALSPVPIAQVNVFVDDEPVTTYLFKSDGYKDIFVTYSNLSSSYTVSVGDPLGIGNADNGDGGDGDGPGIIIIGP